MGGMDLRDGHGVIHYDQSGQRYRLSYDVRLDTFERNGTQHQDTLYKNITGATGNFTVGRGVNGLCNPTGTNYTDLFGWLQRAQRIGSKVIAGKPCDIWAEDEVEFLFLGWAEVHNEACIGSDGVPLVFNKTSRGEKVGGYQSFELSDPAIGDPGDEAFRNTEACEHFPSPPCPSNRTATLSMYRMWGPPEPLDLTDRNAGDALGDLSFLCTQGSAEAYRSKLITLWAVEVSLDFGQYAMCNFNGKRNVCGGTEEQLTHVGRRASQMQGRGPHGGQCSANEDIGSQYSLPLPARCPPGTGPSRGGCAWRARPVRTVSATCVLDERQLLAACRTELGHAPFLKSKAIFEAAFASGDVEQGGCPEVGEPAGASTLLV